MIPPSLRLLEWDRRWLLEFARVPVPPWLDRMLHLVTHAGGVAWTMLLPVLLLFPAASRDLAIQLLLANVSSHLLVQVLKRTVARPRPSTVIARFDAPVRLPDRFSFPSGHACAATAIALPFLMASHAVALPMALLAGLVGVSRVYLRVHYPSDVLAGHLIGALGGIAVSGL